MKVPAETVRHIAFGVVIVLMLLLYGRERAIGQALGPATAAGLLPGRRWIAPIMGAEIVLTSICMQMYARKRFRQSRRS